MLITYQIASGHAEIEFKRFCKPRDGRKYFEAMRIAKRAEIVAQTRERFTLKSGESFGTR